MNKAQKKILVVVGIGNYKSSDTEAVFKCRDAVMDCIRSTQRIVESFEIHENTFSNEPERIIFQIKELSPDCVFNLFEGFCGNARSEASFAYMLEKNNIPFTGNRSKALEICLDKDKTKKILDANGIAVPGGALIKTLSDLQHTTFSFPAFVKPAFEDASVGIDKNSLVKNNEELFASVSKKLSSFPSGLIVEEFISGKEFNAAFLGEYPYEHLGISSLDYSPHPDCPNYLNFNSKWKDGAVEYEKLMPRVLDRTDPDYRNDIIDISRSAAKALGCSRYFRVDLREKNEKLHVLDVNPNPDISPDSGLARQAAARDIDYSELISKILNNAHIM